MPALDLRGIVKTYGDTRANDSVDLVVEWGQVHALLGENGAGKSTLMNVAYGLTRADAGEIHYDGHRVTIASPQDAIALGIGMVHQHFMLIPVLTVAENVMLGRETAGRLGWIEAERAVREIEELGRRYGLEVDPRARVQDLSVGEQQRVEIIKALYRRARLLILDEPTSVLVPAEVERLFEVVHTLTSEGCAVIFITHKLAEVMEVADEITVMRRGRVVAGTRPADSSLEDLATLMVGRPVLLEVEKGPANPGRKMLELHGVTVLDDRRQVAVNNLSLEVRSGEIVGIAGVDGNGQSELVEAIAGLRRPRSGRIVMDGEDITRAPTHRLLNEGMGHIPADRQHVGLVVELPLSDNLVLSSFDRSPYARGVVRMFDVVRRYATGLIREYDIRTEGPDQAAGDLSGGNQQKVVVARELGRQPAVLLAAQPTRGVDVGSVEFIHKQFVAQRDAGLAVLLVSSELDEVLSLADRVAVMYRGRIVAVLEGDQIDRNRVGVLMAGGEAA